MLRRWSALGTAGLSGAGVAESQDLQFVHECLSGERLHQVLVSAGFDRTHHAVAVALGRDHHDSAVVEAVVLAERAQQLEAVDVRHVPVDQEQFRRIHFA